MWRATVLAAGLAFALGGTFADQAAAQGKGVGKASEKFEKRDERRPQAGRVAGRGVTQDDGRRDNDPWYSRDRDRDRDRDRARRGERDSDRDSDRYGYGQGKEKNGPAFCRSGAGHPVHGREWCRQKGFRLGNDRWGRAGWEDIIFGRRDRRYDYGRMNGSVLEDILGRVVFGRLNTQSRQLGGGTLWGQWLTPSGGPRILQVYAGSRPLAEIYDQNRDGRSDIILLNFGR